MQPSLPRLAFLPVLALLVTVASGAQAQTPAALPPLAGDTQSRAAWINDWGEAAGDSIGSGGTTAVVWDENGTPTPLPPLEGSTESHVAFGNSINNKGEITGTSFGGVNETRGVVWNRNGTILMVFQPLEPGGFDPFTTAIAISAHGRVVGVSGDGGGGSLQAVMWDQKGNPTVLSQFSLPCDGLGSFVEPTSITPQSRVSGRCTGITGEGVVWNRKGEEARGLPPLPGQDNSNGISINSKGEVAGDSSEFEVDFSTRPVVWDQKGSPRELLMLPGDVSAQAFGINNKGVVVGSGTTGAVMWDRDGNPTPLPPLAGDTRAIAFGINRRNVVVGTSFDGSSNKTAVIWR